jgi:pimeloyl-ACP methyl ester carboxylesterase
VLFLHGFPQFWWCWRHQLPQFADLGYRAAAADLRGYGGTDKPPRGYDALTLAADVAGLVRALGEERATLVGHDWGALLAWCTALLHPRLVRRLVVSGIAHPLAHRRAMMPGRGGQLSASHYLFAFQLPWRPERWLVRDQGAETAGLLHQWAAPGWPDPESERRYRDAIRIAGVAHSSVEYYRWMVRSQLRPDGRRFARLLRQPVSTDTLQLHGAADSCVLAGTARGSRRYVAGRYDWKLLDAAGHFVAEEAPEEFGKIVADWLTT